MIVDDHPLVRAYCRAAIEAAGHFVVADVPDGEAALREFARLQPDVVVLDLSMPGVGGLETISRLRTRSEKVRILVLSMHDEPAIAARAIRAGANGYVTKSAEPAALGEALVRVMNGESYLCREVAVPLAFSNINGKGDALESLTAREYEILAMLSDGTSSSAIALALSLSPKTVANIQTRIRQKLNVATFADMIRFAISHGICKRNVIAAEVPGARGVTTG